MNLDLHAQTAAEMYGIPVEQVTPAQRRKGKQVNFGLHYGIHPLNPILMDDAVRRYARKKERKV